MMETKNKMSAVDSAGAGVARKGSTNESFGLKGKFAVQCFDKYGKLKWEDNFDNLVVDVGKNEILDQALAGSAFTATWYMGLVSSVSYGAGAVAGDTMASHTGWTEAGVANAPTYSEGARPTAAWSAAATGSKALSADLSFSITSTGTVKGCFLADDATKDGATGILLSSGLFTGGDKAVGNGDTLNVSYTMSA